MLFENNGIPGMNTISFIIYVCLVQEI